MRRMINVIILSCMLPSCAPLVSQRKIEAEKAYQAKMQASAFDDAAKIAREAGLDRQKLLNAAHAEMWIAVSSGIVFSAHATAERAGLTPFERRAFAETAFDLLIAKMDCQTAAELARFFDLPDARKDEAVVCARREMDISYALYVACRHGSSKAKFQELARELARTIADGYGYWYKRAERYIGVCEFEPDLEALLFEKLLDMNDFELAAVLTRRARSSGRETVAAARAEAMFGKALKEGRTDTAKGLMEEKLAPLTPENASRFIEAALPRYECDAAVKVAYDARLSDEMIEGIFASPKCSGASMTGVVYVIPESDDDLQIWYLHLAVKYGKFRLAWAFAEGISDGNAHNAFRRPAKDHVLERAYAADAYTVIIDLPGIDRSKVIEHALDHGEEWFAATVAEEHAEHPEAVVERAYLRAMERGEAMLAVQIAEKYGKPGKLKARARIAFEYAMLAEDAEIAQRILKTAKIEDPALERRAALMRYEQRQKALREKRRQERLHKKRRQKNSDDWNIKRE